MLRLVCDRCFKETSDETKIHAEGNTNPYAQAGSASWWIVLPSGWSKSDGKYLGPNCTVELKEFMNSGKGEQNGKQ